MGDHDDAAERYLREHGFVPDGLLADGDTPWQVIRDDIRDLDRKQQAADFLHRLKNPPVDTGNEGPLTADDLHNPRPTVFQRSDGACGMYPGELNVVLGYKETAKSWMAGYEGIQVVRRQPDAKGVLWVDMEASRSQLANRLLDLGASWPEANRFYFSDHGWKLLDLESALQLLADAEAAVGPIGLFVVETLTPVFSLLPGFNPDWSGTSAERLYVPMRAIVRKAECPGWLNDHLNKTGKPTGTGRKLDGIKGAGLWMRTVKPPAPGQWGEFTIEAHRDGSGFVKGDAEWVAAKSRSMWATVRFTPVSRPDRTGTGVSIAIGRYEGRVTAAGPDTGDDDAGVVGIESQYVELLRAVNEATGAGLTRTELADKLGRHRNTVGAWAQHAIDHGWLQPAGDRRLKLTAAGGLVLAEHGR